MSSNSKARPMIFNGEMVRAIIEGRKTQTRRPVKHQPRLSDIMPNFVFPANKFDSEALYPAGYIYPNAMEEILALCPYGASGDLLYVSEDAAVKIRQLGGTPHESVAYRADEPNIFKCYDCEGNGIPMKWTAADEMPREHSRITLEIVSVRVERVQDISEEDAMAEGATAELVPPDGGSMPHVQGFSNIWNSIYNNWIENPWVWVIEFKVHMMNVDSFLRAS